MEQHPHSRRESTAAHAKLMEPNQDISTAAIDNTLHSKPVASTQVSSPYNDCSSETSATPSDPPLKEQSKTPPSRQSNSRPTSLSSATKRLWDGEHICLHDSVVLDELRAAPTRPVLDKNELAEIDIRTLIDNAQLRHDLNFERGVTFSLKNDEEKVAMAQKYFEAIAFELVLHLSDASKLWTCVCSRPTWVTEFKPHVRRLRKFFNMIRQVTKALIKHEHWLIVDDAIDVDLLMNQLRNGSCDLLSLTNWLGGILKQACSPLRDPEVDRATSLLEYAMIRRSGTKLVAGISALFHVFRTMKLDVANHQLRVMLPPMINESVEYIQHHYQRLIDQQQFDQGELWRWFHNHYMFFKAQSRNSDWEYQRMTSERPQHYLDLDNTFADETFLECHAEIVLQSIQNTTVRIDQLPNIFQFDLKRIERIRSEISRIHLQRCVFESLSVILKQCKYTSQVTPQIERDLLIRLADIETNTPSTEGSREEAIATEIVRTAYTISGHGNKLPHRLHLCQVKDLLNPHSRAGKRLFGLVYERIIEGVREMVFEELTTPEGIAGLLPSQILDRYRPIVANGQPASPLSSQIQGHGQSQIVDECALAVRLVAQDIAHVTLIQYRIWADMVLLKDWTIAFSTEQEFSEWERGVVELVRERYPSLGCQRLGVTPEAWNCDEVDDRMDIDVDKMDDAAL